MFVWKPPTTPPSSGDENDIEIDDENDIESDNENDIQKDIDSDNENEIQSEVTENELKENLKDFDYYDAPVCSKYVVS